jgi:hypothetical protein
MLIALLALSYAAYPVAVVSQKTENAILGGITGAILGFTAGSPVGAGVRTAIQGALLTGAVYGVYGASLDRQKVIDEANEAKEAREAEKAKEAKEAKEAKGKESLIQSLI